MDYGVERGGVGQETQTYFCLNSEDRMCALCHFACDVFGLVISSHSVQTQWNVSDFAEAPIWCSREGKHKVCLGLKARNKRIETIYIH